MRIETLLISVSALFIALFLLVTGFLLFLFPDMHLNLKVMGLFFIFFALFSLTTGFIASRRRYLLVKMGGVAIEEKVLTHFARESLSSLFPDAQIGCDVILHKKGKVEILAHIPYLSEEKREQKLHEIETLLCAALRKYCGWKGSFIFNVSFS